MSKLLNFVLMLVSVVSAAFAVDAFYVREAEAQERQEQLQAQAAQMERKLQIQEERDKLESDLQVTRLEIKFLEELDEPSNRKDREKRAKRLEYLRDRETALEDRLYKLRDKV